MVRRLLRALRGAFGRDDRDDQGVAPRPARRNGAAGVEAVWTPMGFRLRELREPPATEDGGVAAASAAAQGRAGYGGTDTSPPGAGYGIGRTYD